MLSWSIALLILSASAEESPDASCLLQHRVDVVRKDISKPWDHHLYLVGTRHKAGSQVLRNIMHLAFDALGAKLSCQEHSFTNAVITTTGGDNKCYSKPHIPIHWDNACLGTKVLDLNRRIGAEISKPFRGVHIIRDPLQMVASAYCYHHRGNEKWNVVNAPPNIMEMGYEEGVPAVAGTMLPIVKAMVKAYQASGTDFHVVRYEDLTRSSQSFDYNVAQLFDAMFGGLITDSEMTKIKELAKQEDLHHGEIGLSAGNDHVSDDEDKKLAAAALDLIDADLLKQYHELQRVLGYPVGH